ncbi:MAG: tetratricopeptide repeat protein [Mangrovibacterium sp.]
MSRNSTIIEFIDRYLNQDLTGDELGEFISEIASNPDIEAELNLHREVEAAVSEGDIVALRDKLNHLYKQEQHSNEEGCATDECLGYNFELSEDISSIKEFMSPVSISDILNFAQSLPKMHLAQHKVAEKENIHHYYKEQLAKDNTPDEEFMLSPDDEMLINHVEQAIAEKDIDDLRSNLQQIAAGIPEHRFSFKEIDQYLDGEIDPLDKFSIESELPFNQGLIRDIELLQHINMAIGETDIMELRNSLNAIQNTELSTPRKIEELDRFVQMELNDDDLASFESELTTNPDLAAELELYRDSDQAGAETDVMNLRNKLSEISKDIVREKRKERTFVSKIPGSRFAVGAVAASLILFISITSLLSRHTPTSESELYSQFFSPYEATGIFRSGDNMDSKLSLALHTYNEGQLNESMELFKQILETEPDNPVSNFYLGMACQETGNYPAAIKSYQRVILANNNLFVEQAQWYAALCGLQTENRKKVYKQFQQIAEQNSYYSPKAMAILQELDELTE